MEDNLIPYEGVRSLGVGPVLVLAPHGDDEVFGCGGAILRHVEAGDRIRVVVVTDGAAEIPSDADPGAYAEQRREESRAAGRLLGYGEPEFWDFPDRSLQYGEALVQRVQGGIRDSGARLIYAPSVLEMHPDHRVLGMVAIEAVRRSGGDHCLVMYEIGVPLRPNRLLDITDLRPRKRAAMALFESQLAQRDYLGHVEALNRFRAYTLPAEVEAAEAYCLAGAEEIQRDPMALYVSEMRRVAALGAPLDQHQQPLLSVIVRSIGRSLLQEALDSLALQTYANIEVIVVDALGTGHAPLPDWCGRFPLRVVATGEPLSRSRAANLGLDAARGEYIAFLDDDDLLDPNHFPALVHRLAQYPSTRAVYAGVRVVDSGPEGNLEVVRTFHEAFNPRRLIYENYIPIHAVVFHRSLLDAGCRFEETLDAYEDWDFWLQMALHTPFACVDQVSASYRSGGGSGVGLLHEQQKDVIENRYRLYQKWLARWDAQTLDWIFDDYRRVRHEGVICREALNTEILEREKLDRERQARESALLEQHTELRERHADLRERHANLVCRVNQLEYARSQKLLVRIYRVVRDWRVMAPVRWMVAQFRVPR